MKEHQSTNEGRFQSASHRQQQPCNCLGRYWGKHQRLWKERSQTMESSPEDGRNPSQNQTIQQPTHTNSRHQMRRNVR